MFASSHSLTPLIRAQEVQETVLAVFLLLQWLLQWLGLWCLSSLSGGLHHLPLSFHDAAKCALAAWNAVVDFFTLVIFPLTTCVYIFQVAIASLGSALSKAIYAVTAACKTVCRAFVHAPTKDGDVEVGSKKELRHMRKKARRKAARADNGPADPPLPDAPSTPPHDIPPQTPDPSEPGSARNVKTNGHSTTEAKDQEGRQTAKKGTRADSKQGTKSKQMFEGSTLRPDSPAAPAPPPPRQPKSTHSGQEGWQPARSKNATRKQAGRKRAAERASSGSTTSRPGPPASTTNKAAIVPPTHSSLNRASAATGAAASRQRMPAAPSGSPNRPVPRAPTAPPGFAASDRPYTRMGERDLLVGPLSLVQVLKNKLAMVPQAACNLVCLETGLAGISAYRPVRGDGNCGYRAVMAGLIESAQSSGHLKGHLLQRLPELLKTIVGLGIINRVGTSYATHLQQGCSHLMEAVGNQHNLPVEDLLESCRQQKASDEMLLFVRAICAAGLLLEPADSLVQLTTMLEEAQVHCRAWDLEKCLKFCVLPLGGRNRLMWFDEYSIKGLAAALGVGIRLYNVSSGEGPLEFTYPEGAEASFNLIKHGVHYDLVN